MTDDIAAAPPLRLEPADEAAREMLEGDQVDLATRPLLPILAPISEQRVWVADRHERRVRFGVLGLTCIIFLTNLGAFGLWDCWETHYGAVTTEMLDSYDWVSPWWGYRQQIGEEPKQGEPFYSKPIFIFWTESAVARVIGRGEWAIRLPCALLAILAVFLTYLAVSKIWSRKTGLLAAGVMATSPFFFMVSRQAQTDMLYVATMTIAMCFLLLAFFGPREPMTDRKFKRWSVLTLGFVLINTLPQYGILLSDFSFPSEGSIPNFPSNILHQGWVHALFWTLALAGVLFWFIHDYRNDIKREGLSDEMKGRWVRRFYLIAFYCVVAQSFTAKGLLGPGLPGLIILVWLLVSWNWRVLLRAEILRGILIFLCIGFPWYMAMQVKHGAPYFQRWWIHDHFNRAFSGVHQIDSGTFDHFVKWLGIGFFPWVAFLPLALIWLLRSRARDNSPQNQAKIFFAVWALIAFTIFSYLETKFHHYIFPAVPAMAVLVALYIRHLMKDKSWLPRFSAVVGIVFLLGVGWNLHEDPQHLRNLMTYKYDRPMPTHLPIDENAKVSDSGDTTWKDSYFWKHTSGFMHGVLQFAPFKYETWIPLVIIGSALMLGLFFVAKTRKAGLVGLGLLAGAMSLWSLNYYMPTLTPHWSQKYLFDSYYDTCTLRPESDEIKDAYEPLVGAIGLGFIGDYLRSEPKRICEEDILAWLITWRGETYYSYNELKPLGKKEQLVPYLDKLNGGRKVYFITERGKQATIRSEMKAASDQVRAKGNPLFANIRDWDVKIENDENLYFQTLSATPIKN